VWPAEQPGLVGRERRADGRRDDHAAERDVAGGHRLGERRQVGLDAEVLAAEPASEATEAADHLVEDQVATVLVGQSPQAGEVALRRRVDAARALHRLGEDGATPSPCSAR
jgi:hypothetical protein